MTNSSDVLLFDLGGVLVEVATIEHVIASLGLDSGPETMQRLATLDVWPRLEIGEIEGPVFCEQFIAGLGLRLQASELLTLFESWNVGLFPGAVELLAELRGRYRLAVLSNTNAIHWQRLSGEMNIPGLVDRVFSSHLIGLRKPDEQVYRHVAAELGVELGDLVFFDDLVDNIEAARSLGMRAWQVQGVTALRERLEALGYL